jgi:hypothetical protein
MEIAITRDMATLEQLEKEMREDIHAFYRFGTNLIKIRNEELYLHKNGGEYQTFESYCKGVWDMTDRYARNLMASSGVIDNLTAGTIVPVKPFTESQTRPLVKLTPEKQREAWQQAVATAPDGKVTAAHVYKIVKGMTAPEKPVQKPNLNEPIIKQELVSKEFQAAYDQMVVELKNARAMKWQTTSHKAAMDMMQVLLTISEQMGR